MNEQAEHNSESSTSMGATEASGERFIQTADGTRTNWQTGVGRCALHPCLTRRATITGVPEEREDVRDVPIGRSESLAQGGEPVGRSLESRGLGLLGRGSEQLTQSIEPLTQSIEPLGRIEPSGNEPENNVDGQLAASFARARISTDMRSQSEVDLHRSDGTQLAQKRRELAQAGKRHSEATAQALRTMERGLAENRRSGADTPTVDLVQTAVSVREVSKLIGRTVVQMSNVRRIMIVTKPGDTSLVSLTRDLAVWLVESPRDSGAPVVYIEEWIARHRNFGMQRVLQKHPGVRDNVQLWTPELCSSSPEIFDFVVTLGGDGTVLYTSWLFQTTVPPIIPFHLGSLGFLTVFDHRHARRVLDSAFRSGVRINLRMRFTCTVYRLAEEAAPEHANVLVAAADCNRLISHEIATHGLQSGDERVYGADGELAAINSMKAGRARGSQKRKPSATSVSALGLAPMSKGRASRTHGRRRSSANQSSLSEPESEDNARSTRTPRLTRTGSAYAVRSSGKKGEDRSKPVVDKVKPMAKESTTVAKDTDPVDPPKENDSEPDVPGEEWGDVPKAYQRRVRKVWKRDSTFQVMNEVVVDRGPSPYLAQIELYGDGTHLTTVEADGLCLATPTGSTAYSLAAGGSLVHPEIPAILVTPICAHTLSFRPMLLPDSMVLRVVIPPDSRNTVWASFDGRHRIELRRGDHIQITASKYPLPTVCASQSQTQDWMSSLSRCLNWNERKRQKKFTMGLDGESDKSDDGGNAADEGSAVEEDAGIV
ncbi:hypothetical protein GGH96_001978 [Coemansia sp. RSA 1972]|nr:hypothetical protein GGH96_001978 [Coemansia sp. RSA 1972]